MTTKTRNLSQNIKHHDIIYSIIIDDYEELKKLVNSSNVNEIIDDKNKYNALHYAIYANKIDIIDYLLLIGADPYLKNGDRNDAFDMSLKFQSRILFDYIHKKLNQENCDLCIQIDKLEKKIADTNENNDYLQKSMYNLTTKFNIFKNEVFSLKRERILLKDKNDNLEKNILSLQDDNNKLKRDYESLNQSYDGLLTKIKKNK